ncbi:MAG: 2Fe-2S iron-sulfur cluster-binding protein [candidate division WOR-3 bacterium]|nr:2Fe-2S iron-sulfur cluster-binding protein [candidate division WOR-3 bacterium]
MITITINGKRIKAKKGETVLRIAERAGIRIPTLCYHKDLTPYGGCRLCIVEVKGTRIPLTACTLNAEHGMVIKTDTPHLRNLRRFTLQLMLSEHPNACLICEREADCANFQECIKKSAVTFGCKSCPQNENCALQDMVRELGIKDIPFDFRYRGLELERHDPFFDRDYNLCILCGRCIRVCDEIRGAHTLAFHHRGPDTLVGTAFDLPHLESDCQFCGACVDFCPTGALRGRFSRYDKPPEKVVKTTCMLCSVGCQIDLNVSEEKITCSTPHDSQLCARGRFGIAPLVHHPKRITVPLMKKGDAVIEVEWAEALAFVASKLHEYRNHTGVLLTPELTSEAIGKVYSLADLAKMKIAVEMDPDNMPEALNLTRAKGKVAFVILNTDLVADYSVLLLGLRKRYKNNAVFIVIDPVVGRSNRFADAVLNPVQGAENDVLQLLSGSKRTNSKTGIPAAEIEAAKSLISGRKIFVLYDPANAPSAKIKKPLNALPLHSKSNMLTIAGLGFDSTPGQMLADKNIDCLYAIGSASDLSRKYKTVIVQDCFLPDFEFDVFLPAATFAESNGSVQDISGKSKNVRCATAPAGKAMPDDKIIDELARTMNIRLKKRLQKRTAKRTKRIHPSKVSKKYPLTLIARQNTYGYRNKTLSAVLKGFDRLRGDRCIWLNERTAAKYRLKEGMNATLAGPYGAHTARVKISSSIPDDAVLIYYHQSTRNFAAGPVRIECIRS